MEILSEPLCKDDNTRFTTGHIEAFSDQGGII